jgi:hypothetical protein
MKFNMKRTALVTALLIFSGLAMGAKITDDKLKVGNPTSGANKELVFDNGTATPPSVRLNTSSTKLEFTNDGTNYKAIGSGSGGASGVNYLQDLNGDFEAGATGWTNVGGTFIASSSTPIAGAQSGLFTASATGQTLDSSLITKQLGAGGRTCSATFEYNWQGTAGQLNVRVLDQTNALIAGPVDLVVTTATQSIQAQLPLFECDAATQFKIRITSTAASAALKLDNAFIGYGLNGLQVSQAEVFGQAVMSPTSTPAQTTSASFVNMVYNSAIIATYNGKVSAGSGNDVSIVLANAPAGKYEIIAIHNLNLQNPSGSGSNVCQSRIYDGTSEGDVGQMYGQTIRAVADAEQTGDDENTVHAVYSFSTNQTNKTFHIQARRLGAAAFLCSVATVQWVVKYYPLNANNALTMETSSWFIDANIGGTSPSLGASSISTLTEITSSALTMTVNTGSLPATIPCSSTNPSTGLSCAAGNESIGVTFDLPQAGNVFACAKFSHNATVNNGTVSAGFVLVETGNSNQTVLQSANQKVSSEISTAASVANGFPHTVCGVLKFATAGKKTLRVMYEQFISGTIAGNVLITDQSTNVAERDFHITVIPISNQFPSPVFTDLQNTLNSKVTAATSGIKSASALVIYSGGTPIISRNNGLIQSIADTAVGIAGLTFVPGLFATNNTVCICSPDNGATTDTGCSLSGVSGTGGNVYQQLNGTATDVGFFIRCEGN